MSRRQCLLQRSLLFRFCLGLLQKKPLLDLVHVLSVSSDLVLSLDFAIDSFLSRTILVSNSVPFRSASFPLPFSRLHFVFVSISSMSLQYRRYTLVRSLHVSQPSPPSYSSRYLRQCLPYNIDDTLSNSTPLLILTSVFPTFPSAIFNFYHVAFVDVPSYSVHLLLILLGSLSVPPLFLFTFPNVVSYVPASPTPTYA